MEAKKTKILALAVLTMLCAVAIVGAAYAAFAGNAKTYNEDNNADVGYMTLTPEAAQDGSWTPIVDDVKGEFSSYVYNDSGAKTAYYLINPANTTITIGEAPNQKVYVNKNLGDKDFVLSNKTGENITEVVFEAKASAGVGNNTFVYILAMTDGTTTEYQLLDASNPAAKTFTFDYSSSPVANNGTVTYKATIYIGYVVNGYIEGEYPIGVPAAESTETKTQGVVTPVAPDASDVPAGFADVDFAFKVTVTSVAPTP